MNCISLQRPLFSRLWQVIVFRDHRWGHLLTSPFLLAFDILREQLDQVFFMIPRLIAGTLPMIT